MKCDISGCETEATYLCWRIESRRLAGERYFCEQHAYECFLELRSKVFAGAGTDHAMPGAVCVDLEIITYHTGPEDTPGCVYLREVRGDRSFCTMVDSGSYSALMAELRREVAPRPRTHAGWAATIRELGGKVQDVVLDKLSDADQWLDARVRIIKDGRLVNVDLRLSDAYIVAVTNDVPIFAVEKAMKRSGSGGGW